MACSCPCPCLSDDGQARRREIRYVWSTYHANTKDCLARRCISAPAQAHFAVLPSGVSVSVRTLEVVAVRPVVSVLRWRIVWTLLLMVTMVVIAVRPVRVSGTRHCAPSWFGYAMGAEQTWILC